MTVREKLLALIQKAKDECANDYSDHTENEYIADTLLDNGVTFATDTNDGCKWIGVEDRLPEIVSTTRAGRNTYRRSARVLCACLQADGKRFVKEGYMEFFNDYPKPNWIIPGTIHSVTHWMPLPKPPKED